MFQFTILDYSFEWNYSHTVNVWDWDGKNIDVFELDYSTNNNTRLDAIAAALDWMDNV
jgi:hypothetical protein